MNHFTALDQFKKSPDFILKNSDLLDPKDCKIVNNVLYERADMKPSGYIYRFYFDVDDYDYVVSPGVKEELDLLFKDNV